MVASLGSGQRAGNTLGVKKQRVWHCTALHGRVRGEASPVKTPRARSIVGDCRRWGQLLGTESYLIVEDLQLNFSYEALHNKYCTTSDNLGQHGTILSNLSKKLFPCRLSLSQAHLQEIRILLPASLLESGTLLEMSCT